jgi:hypothetical protein
MKKALLFAVSTLMLYAFANAQNIKPTLVPAGAKTALLNKYPEAKKVTWEKEKGNYEANWGGKSGEDMSVQFTPNGEFIEQVKAINVTKLPALAATYIKQHYKTAKISEAGKVTNAKGENFFEAEVNGKDLLFNEKGNFVKIDK